MGIQPWKDVAQSIKFKGLTNLGERDGHIGETNIWIDQHMDLTNIWIPFSQMVIFTGGLIIGNRVSHRKMGSSASRTLAVTSWPPSFNSLHVGGPGRGCFCRYFLEEKMFPPPLCSFSGFLLLCFSDSLHFCFLCCFPGLFLCFLLLCVLASLRVCF